MNIIKQVFIEVNHVTKKYGSVIAVENVSLSVYSGDIYALIGENGAGKTSLIKMMTGLLYPDQGLITLLKYSMKDNPEESKRIFGYVSDNPTVYGHLTAFEFFYFAGRLRGINEEKIKMKIEELIPLFGLGSLIYTPMSDYSRGNRQKIAFIAALLSDPKILIIDEPIVGLDPDSIEIFGKMLKKFTHQGGAVFFSTHILSFAEKYATRVGVLHKGIMQKEIMMGDGVNINDLYHIKK